MENQFTRKQQAALQKAKTAASREALKKLYAAQRAGTVRPKAARPGPRPQTIPNFLDPMCPFPMPTLASEGRALPHTGLVSSDFTVDTTNTTLLLVANTGHSGTVAFSIKLDASGGPVSGSTEIHTIPTLSVSDHNGGPTTSRSMKLSISVVNCTNNYKRGGRVTYINSSQRLPPRNVDFATEYARIVSGVKSSPYRRRINGEDLVKPKHLITFPVDNKVYHSYDGFHGTLTAEEFLSYLLTPGDNIDTKDAVITPRPMSTVAWIFDPAPDEQAYSFTVRASFYTRWPLTSVPGQTMHNVPTAPAAVLNAVVDKAEAHGSDLVELAAGGAAVAMGSRISGVARSIGSGVQAVGSGIGQALGRAFTSPYGEAVAAGGSEGGLLAGMEGLSSLRAMQLPLLA